MSNRTGDKVFICYARADKKFVNRLCTQLMRSGIPVWRDTISIPPADLWRTAITKGLTESQTCLVVLSPASMRSPFVTHEWSYAMGMGKRVMPLLLPGVRLAQMHDMLRALQYVDFSERTRWAHLLAPLGARPSEAPQEAVAPRIRAQFELTNGKPIKRANNEYPFILSVENAPEDAKRVTYEIHDDTFYQPVWTEKNAAEGFRSECSSYGDILITATFKGGKPRAPVETMLHGALVREHGKSRLREMKQALDDIRKN